MNTHTINGFDKEMEKVAIGALLGSLASKGLKAGFNVARKTMFGNVNRGLNTVFGTQSGISGAQKQLEHVNSERYIRQGV